MASIKSPIFTNQQNRDISLHADQSVREIVGGLKVVRIPYTLLGTEANTDTIELCYPQIEGFLIPELSRASNTGAGDADLDFVLREVNAAGTATALTAAASLDNNSVAFARPSGNVVPQLLKSDYLQLLLSNVEGVAAGDVIVLELVFAVFKHD